MVAVEPVFDCIVFQVVPPLVDLSTMYPVIGLPPLFAGAVHERLICEEETDVAVSPVGEDGAVMLLCVVADAVFDGELVPTEFIADTLYV